MRGRGISYFVLAFLLFFACKSQKNTIVAPEVAKESRPEWLRHRPITNDFYVGISGAQKQNGQFDYAQNAKSRALEDLASEIKVKIESNSVLFQLERNNSFKDSYESVIKNKTSQEIEDFELVDAWETDTEYWVYYRLSKVKFKERQREKRETAQNLALDLYKKGNALEQKGDAMAALRNYLAALTCLQDYLGELNEVSYEGKQVYLTSEIYNAIELMMREIKIASANEMDYKRGVSRNQVIDIRVTYKSKPLRSIPLKAYFSAGKGQLSEGVQTNENGNATFVLSSVSSQTASQAIIFELDFEEIKQQNPLNEILLKTVQAPKQLISLSVSGPTIYIKTDEKNLGERSSSTVIKDYLVREIVNEGFAVSNDSSPADLICSIESDTKKGSDNSGIYTSYLTVSVTIQDKNTYKVIYSGKLSDIKGVQLDFENAGNDAYKKALKEIDKKILPEMQKVIFE